MITSEARVFLGDMSTGNGDFVVLDLGEQACAFNLCYVQWMPSGTELATIIGTTDSDGTSVVTGIQTFAPCTESTVGGLPHIDCPRAAILPIRGYPAGLGAWSPDGRNVIVTDEPSARLDVDGAEPAYIVDVATGEVVGPWAGSTSCRLNGSTTTAS